MPAGCRVTLYVQMLKDSSGKGIEIPLTTTSRDKTELTVEQKLENIKRKQAIRARVLPEMGYVSFRLPHVDGITVEFVEKGEVMSINHFNIGDRDLCRRGIGTVLLRRAVDYGLRCSPNLRKLTHASANLALVNTVIGVVGEENVTIINNGERYGQDADQPLEAMFDTSPVKEGSPYLVDRVEAVLDRDAIAARPQPEYSF